VNNRHGVYFDISSGKERLGNSQASFLLLINKFSYRIMETDYFGVGWDLIDH
jgi:hypothetical protein